MFARHTFSLPSNMKRLFLSTAVLCSSALGLIACGSAEPPTAPDAVRVDSTPPIPIGTGVMGRLVRTGYSVSGTVTLAVSGTTARLEFSSDFAIANTPGPFIYLNTTNNPNSGRPIRVGGLRSRTGAQSYSFQLPPGVSYEYVIIWCDPFNVAMAEAKIPPTGASQ